MSGKFITQKGMNEIRHIESIVNSRMRRAGIDGYLLLVKCGCSDRQCGGFAVIRLHEPAPKPKPKKSHDSVLSYRQWLEQFGKFSAR